MSGRYEVFAVRYGTRTLLRSEAFYRYPVYGEADAEITIDYFFWVLRSPDHVVLVDTGFDPAAGLRRKRTVLVDPIEALGLLGIEPTDVAEVIVSHCHYDHIGNLSRLPEATFVVEASELEFWTGSYATRAQFAEPTEPSEIEHLAEAAHRGRVQIVNGAARLAPELEVVAVGGHTPGQLVTLVGAAEDKTVLASDALHFYEEMERDMPFAIFSDLAATYRAYDTLRELENSGGRIVAGHDPQVPARFSAGQAASEHIIQLA